MTWSVLKHIHFRITKTLKNIWSLDKDPKHGIKLSGSLNQPYKEYGKKTKHDSEVGNQFVRQLTKRDS